MEDQCNDVSLYKRDLNYHLSFMTGHWAIHDKLLLSTYPSDKNKLACFVFTLIVSEN